MARYGKILMLAALVGLLVTDFEGHAGPSSTPGVTVTRSVPSVKESLSDVQARSPNLEEPAPRDRHIRRHRIPRSGDTETFSPTLSLSLSQAAPLSNTPAPMAPALDAAFPNGFPGLLNPTTFDVIPPDTMGAAGPNHLVSLLNSQFGVFDKTTGSLSPGSVVRLETFWNFLDAGTNNASVFAFDPKILYDTNSGRFIAVTLSAHGDSPPSWIFIAVSSTNDPTGPNDWVKVAIDADEDADNVVRNNWADYPGLGVDANNIYVTANMFDNTANPQFQYSKVWVIPIDQLLNGAPANLTWTEIRDPVPQGQPGRDSIQPAHSFDGATTEYLVREAGSGRLGLASITGGTTWTDLGTISVASFASASELPGVPQFGNPNTIDPGDTRLLNAVYRNGSLWTTHHVAGAGEKLEVAWYQVDPVGGTPPVSGRIGDPLRWFFYPSIAVNANSDVAIGFSGSSSADFASAYYTARKSTDPAGTMQPPSLLKTGVATYFKILSGTENRWGDFSATVVDPSDNVTFWTLQEYAATPRASDGRSMWGTWWGKFRPPAIASPFLTATVRSTTEVDLTWTLPGGQTGFRVERRQLPGGDFSLITPVNLPPDATTYIDNTGAAGSTYAYRVRALNAGGDSFSNEATTTSVGPPPAPPVGGGGGGGGCGVSNGKTREGDFSPLTTVLILLSPIGIHVIRRHLIRSSR